VKRIVTPKYVEHVTMNIYVKDSQIPADLSTLSATGKAQKGKKFFVDLLMGPSTALSKTEVTNGRLKHSDGYLANRSSKNRFFNDVPAEINKRHKKGKVHERMNAKENQKDRSQRTEVCPGFHTADLLVTHLAVRSY
jgi:hypothetical protein